ncbi:hypothetical protein MRX96_031064 [Rhipicephalus microplus]
MALTQPHFDWRRRESLVDIPRRVPGAFVKVSLDPGHSKGVMAAWLNRGPRGVIAPWPGSRHAVSVSNLPSRALIWPRATAGDAGFYTKDSERISD